MCCKAWKFAMLRKTDASQAQTSAYTILSKLNDSTLKNITHVVSVNLGFTSKHCVDAAVSQICFCIPSMFIEAEQADEFNWWRLHGTPRHHGVQRNEPKQLAAATTNPSVHPNSISDHPHTPCTQLIKPRTCKSNRPSSSSAWSKWKKQQLCLRNYLK